MRSPHLRSSLFALLAVLSFGCGGEQKKTAVSHLTPFDRLRRVATVWRQDSEDSGLLQGDPNGVASFSVRTKMRLTLNPDGATAKEEIERDERFELTTGDRFVCKAKGEVAAAARYAWREHDVMVTIENREARLPRRCDHFGFPVETKLVAPHATTFLLESDQLVSTEPLRTRDVLVPAQ